VPIAKQFSLGSVLGYLIAGVIIGPHLLGLVGQGGGGVMHVAEFGVVMMLFLVGLELRANLRAGAGKRVRFRTDRFCNTKRRSRPADR